MKLDQNDFRLFEGYFYPEIPNELAVDCFGHKLAHFTKGVPVAGAFIYLDENRRDFLHANHYPNGFNLEKWIQGHRNIINLLVTEKPIEGLRGELPQFVVPNTWEFYKNVAAYIRHIYGGHVITITGSVGKSTTRLMIVRLLEALKHQVATNIGNDNVRQVTVPLLTTLLQNPDELVAELSINALNNREGKRGAISRLYKADTAIITQIGGAHLAGLEKVKDPLLFLAERKSRIFQGMSENGNAVINFDMIPRVYRYAVHQAQKQTKNIYTFSKNDQRADAYIVKTVDFKNYTEITMSVLDEKVTAILSMPGNGVMMDLLAACLTLRAMGLKLPDMSKLFLQFQALNSELKFHQILTSQGETTIVDDTHGSTLYSVDNIFSVFNTRGKFYHGKKVLVMETGEDLGENAVNYNLKFNRQILDGNIDMVIGYRDTAIQPLIDSVSDSVDARFYDDIKTLMKVISKLPADSLVIVKSSDGRKYGSDLWTLPDKLIGKLNYKEKLK